MNTTRTSLFLMANLGAEVSRLISSKKKGDIILARAAQERAQRIIEDVKMSSDMRERHGEIDMLADVLSDFGKEQRQYSVNAEELENYFRPFALRLLQS